MLKAIGADIVQELLEGRDAHHTIAAKGVHLVVGDLGLAQVGTNAPILIVG